MQSWRLLMPGCVKIMTGQVASLPIAIQFKTGILGQRSSHRAGYSRKRYALQ